MQALAPEPRLWTPKGQLAEGGSRYQQVVNRRHETLVVEHAVSVPHTFRAAHGIFVVQAEAGMTGRVGPNREPILRLVEGAEIRRHVHRVLLEDLQRDQSEHRLVGRR